MNMRIGILAAGVAAALTATAGLAQADQFLGSYTARIGHQDHFASDGYPLDSAAQMVRQDRANYHKFHRRDADDEGDPWFGSASARASFERMLNRGSAMNGATRSAIANGSPVVEVEVYRNSVNVRVVGY